MSYLKNSKLSTVNKKFLQDTVTHPTFPIKVNHQKIFCPQKCLHCKCSARMVGCASLSFQLSGKCAEIQRPTRVCQFVGLHVQGDATLMRSGHRKNTRGFHQAEINAVAKSMKSFTTVWKNRRKSHILLF